MKRKNKTNIFLGGFINVTNAQNLNCLALAKHLDNEKFEVYTLQLFSGNLESQEGKISGVHIFKCFKPFRISGYFGFLWGIWNCDVAYLPKYEFWKWNRFLLKLFKKKSFSTVEGILDQENLNSAVEVLGNYKNVVSSKKYFTKLYAITHFLGRYNAEHHGIQVDAKTLYLGCDSGVFENDKNTGGELKKVVYIGRLKKRKGIYDFIEVAESFPDLQFYIFGDGEERISIETLLAGKNLNHIHLMGIADHQTLASFLKEADLHILPSRSEGFPKVILETAAAGVPSVVYDDYGAQEWITSGVNGWVVKSVDDIAAIISDLSNNPNKLKVASETAVMLAVSFDWNVKMKDWEKEIMLLAQE